MDIILIKMCELIFTVLITILKVWTIISKVTFEYNATKSITDIRIDNLS